MNNVEEKLKQAVESNDEIKKENLELKNTIEYYKKEKERYLMEKKDQLAKQNKSIDIIKHTVIFLVDRLSSDSSDRKRKITMHEILTYLNDSCNYPIESTKVISQFNYLLMDLANAKLRNISNERLNIRVQYIKERLKTAFKLELHERINKEIMTYEVLFKFDHDEKESDK